MDHASWVRLAHSVRRRQNSFETRTIWVRLIKTKKLMTVYSAVSCMKPYGVRCRPGRLWAGPGVVPGAPEARMNVARCAEERALGSLR